MNKKGNLTLHTLEDPEIQVFNNFFLGFSHFYIMIQPRRGVYFQNPKSVCFFPDIAVNNEVHPAETQSHIAGKIYGQVCEKFMHFSGYIYRVAPRRQICIIKKKNSLPFWKYRMKTQFLVLQFNYNSGIFYINSRITARSNKLLLLYTEELPDCGLTIPNYVERYSFVSRDYFFIQDN